MKRVAVGALVALAGLVGVGSASAAPSTSPELVPFTGTRTITATWGAPSGGYHSASSPAIDVSMPPGTPIYAAGAGQVIQADIDPRNCNPYEHGGLTAGVRWCTDNGYHGTRLRIRHPDGRISQYLHLNNIVVPNGAQVAAGQHVAYSGNSGASTGAHLHYAEQNSGGTNIDPGDWSACFGSAVVYHVGLQGRKGHGIRNDGYGCHGEGGAPSAGSPIGHFDELRRHPGGVWVRGWIVDPDSTASTRVHVYAGTGQLGVNNPFLSLSANLDRPDVAAAIGKGAAHGFSGFFPLSAGRHNVCIYGINIAGTPGENVQIQCRVIDVSPEPFGHLDGVRRAPGGIAGSGWAIDPDTDSPIAVHLYSGTGQLGVGNPSAAHRADLLRRDVANVHTGYSVNHGFSGVVRTGSGKQTVCAYAINAPGTLGQNHQIGCKTMDVSPEPFGALESVTRDGNTLTARGWAIDPDTDQPIAVHLYAGNGSIRTGGAHSTTANLNHPEAARKNPGWSTSHGFSGRATSITRPEKVCAYAINAPGTPGSNQQIGCISEASFIIAPPTPAAPPATPAGTTPSSGATPARPAGRAAPSTAGAPKNLRAARLRTATVTRRGDRVRIAIFAKPGRAVAGRSVLVQRKVGARWRTLTKTTVKGGAVRAVLSLKRRAAGLRGARGVKSVTLRLALPKQGAKVAYVGPARTIRVR